jgi:hypothetical protein
LLCGQSLNKETVESGLAMENILIDELRFQEEVMNNIRYAFGT